VGNADSELSSQNVSFKDETPSHKMEIPTVTDSVRSARDATDASFSEFFSRPIKIGEYNWSTSTTLISNFDPWELYLSNPRVENRMSNFYLSRGKLHLKFVVNGNGFHYGRAMACYLPLHYYDGATSTSTLLEGPNVQLSQCPKIFLNPTNNGGGEMCLPFFWYRDNYRLTDDDPHRMGEICIRDLTGLKHANGASDVCNITIFAWMEDVTLTGLTSTNFNALTPQSGTEVDEANMKGVISGPATSVASVANTLKDVPVIGPYAKATSKVASGVASGAKILGFSRPNITKDPEPYKPRPTSNFATTTVPDGAIKLTVDDKQELSIDPGISGIGREDPLTIRSISTRESWLTNFAWAESSGSETLLWNARVTPAMYHESVAGTKYMPALCAASQPFQYWTGSIKYRFQIVCSAYHKGRLKVVFDPVVLGLTPEYNVNYVKIIDIAECTDFTITVPMTQDTTFLENYFVGTTSTTETYSTTRYTSRDIGMHNGVIGVYVVNALTTPNSTVNNDIKVNVFVSSGDDFEVSTPRDAFSSLVFKPQSGLEPQSGTETDGIKADGLDEPENQQEESVMGNGSMDMTALGDVYFGERVHSFRPLLKRFALHETVSYISSSTSRIYGIRSFFPYYRGNIANAVHTTSTAGAYNYVNTLLLHYVTMMFQGMRGSVRYKVTPYCTKMHESATIHVERDMAPRTGTVFKSSALTVETFATIDEASESTVYRTSKDSFPRFKSPPPFINGGTLAIGSLNPTAEFEVPFYSMDRFIPGKVLDWTGAIRGGTSPHSVSRFLTSSREGADAQSTLNIYAAAGEDFQVYFFTGMPPVYYEAAPPTASPT